MKQLSANLGFRGAVSYRLSGWSEKLLRQTPKPITVKVPGLAFPVSMRTGSSSDLAVLMQIALDKMFEPLRSLEGIRTVVDCGANAGYSSAWFLTAFPTSRVIAVEPDTNNARCARENLLPYGERAQVIQSAVWDRHGSVALSPGTEIDTREWARITKEPDQSKPGEVLVDTVTIPDLIAQAGGVVDLLKIDIEWAEKQVFAQPALWLKGVRNLAIELHDDECKRIFFNSIEGFDYDLVVDFHTTICRNIRWSSAAASASLKN